MQFRRICDEMSLKFAPSYCPSARGILVLAAEDVTVNVGFHYQSKKCWYRSLKLPLENNDAFSYFIRLLFDRCHSPHSSLETVHWRNKMRQAGKVWGGLWCHAAFLLLSPPVCWDRARNGVSKAWSSMLHWARQWKGLRACAADIYSLQCLLPFQNGHLCKDRCLWLTSKWAP